MIADKRGRLLAHEVATGPWSDPILPEEYPVAVPLRDYGIVVYLRAAVGNSPERIRAKVERLFAAHSGKIVP